MRRGEAPHDRRDEFPHVTDRLHLVRARPRDRDVPRRPFLKEQLGGLDHGLGMEARAGNLINGSERVEAAARSGQVHLLIHAADAGEDGSRRLDQAWRVGGGDARGVNFPEARTILSIALGRENVVHIALTDPAAASRVRHALARWRAFTDPLPGLEGGAPASASGSADELTKE